MTGFANPNDQQRGVVDTVQLFSNEFGSSPAIIHLQIALGAIEIDDQKYEGNKFSLPLDQIRGKLVSVIGPDRQWRMRYPA